MTVSDLGKAADVQLLDVRLADDYEACHLEGAANNCVFEVSFGDRLAESAPDPSATTVVYGADSESGEAEAAAEKLRRAGYSDVHVLEGGIEAARAASHTLVAGPPVPPAPELADGTHSIDVENSRLQWTGRNLLNKHWGTVPILSGHLLMKDGVPTGGELQFDLLRISCDDLAGSDLHDVLVAHLHSDDFFDVGNFPVATLSILSAERLAEASAGSPNLRIGGGLNLRGQTRPITFDASAGVTPDGKAGAQASFAIDRTRWGVLYGSGKFFRRLAGHLVNDLIDFDVKIVTR